MVVKRQQTFVLCLRCGSYHLSGNSTRLFNSAHFERGNQSGAGCDHDSGEEALRFQGEEPGRSQDPRLVPITNQGPSTASSQRQGGSSGTPHGAQQPEGPTDWFRLTPMGLGASRCYGNDAHVWRHVTAGWGVHSVGHSAGEVFGGSAQAPTLTASLWQAPPSLGAKSRLGSSFRKAASHRPGLTGKGMGASVQPLLSSALTQLPSA